MTIYDHARGRRIDVINMPANEFVEGSFRAVVHVCAQKFPIGLINHILSMPQPEKPDNDRDAATRAGVETPVFKGPKTVDTCHAWV
jgi:hypothetical protein